MIQKRKVLIFALSVFLIFSSCSNKLSYNFAKRNQLLAQSKNNLQPDQDFNSVMQYLQEDFIIISKTVNDIVYEQDEHIKSSIKEFTKYAVGREAYLEKNKDILNNPLILAEQRADGLAKQILETGRKMALIDSTIIIGSCWDYINAVYNRAGFTNERIIIYNEKKRGPYADIDELRPGDWMYFVNYSYHNIGHSAIFVYWKDYEKKIGVTLSYSGENRKIPGKYKEYDLSGVYFITRPGIIAK